MNMTVAALSNVTVDWKKAFKNRFITNALDGSEDYLVSEKIYQLIGDEIKQFRNDLEKEKGPKDFNEMLKTITPPKGIRRKNQEGSELYDCEGEEIEQPPEEENIENDKGKESKFLGYKLMISLYPYDFLINFCILI